MVISHFWDKLWAAPPLLLKKLAKTFLMTIGILFVGMSTYCFTEDGSYLWMSLLVFTICTGKSYRLMKNILNENYVILEGRCCCAAPFTFTQFQQVVLMDDAGERSICRIPKDIKMKPGTRYRLYFLKGAVSESAERQWSEGFLGATAI